MSEPLGFGIVGCGGAARDFARGASAAGNAAIVATFDRDRGRAEALAAATGARAHRRLASLLADPAVEAVYVALPHDRLAPTAVAALGAGRHVLVEKPLATSLAALRRVAEAAAEAGRSVGVLFEQRFTGPAVEARRLVRGGAIGEVASVRVRTDIDKPAAYWRSGPTGLVSDAWRASRRRAGGGVVLMNSIHQLDVVRAVTGLEFARVAALTRASVPGVEVEDAAVAVLELSDGAIGSLVAAAHAPGAERAEEIEIVGRLGALRIPDPYGDPRPLRVFLGQPWRDRPAGRWLDLAVEPIDPWEAVVESFAAAVRGNVGPVPGLDDAGAALATVLAIYRSARGGRFTRVARPG